MTDPGSSERVAHRGENEALVQRVEDALAGLGLSLAQHRRWAAEKVVDALGLEQVKGIGHSDVTGAVWTAGPFDMPAHYRPLYRLVPVTGRSSDG